MCLNYMYYCMVIFLSKNIVPIWRNETKQIFLETSSITGVGKNLIRQTQRGQNMGTKSIFPQHEYYGKLYNLHTFKRK